MIILLPIILFCKLTNIMAGPTGLGGLGGTGNLPILPYPGSIYEKKINFPLIGRQTVETEIITNNYAHIKLEGIINNDGYVKYISNNDRYIFKPSYNLRKLIKKYNIEIISLCYNVENDSIDLNVHIKYIRYKSFIQLERLNW